MATSKKKSVKKKPVKKKPVKTAYFGNFSHRYDAKGNRLPPRHPTPSKKS